MIDSTTGDIQDLLGRATRLAGDPARPPSSGYLLLAILSGSGTAARTLSLRGLSETRVRNAIREAEADPAEVLDRVEAKARQYATSLGGTQPSSLHVLAALAAVRQCQAHRILVDAGLNTDVIRNQALRCLTNGFTREHAGADDPPPDRAEGDGLARSSVGGDALPLPAQLRFPSGLGPRECARANRPGPSSPLPHVGDADPDLLEEGFARQATALEEGGVDYVSVETMMDLREALSAVRAVRRASSSCTVHRHARSRTSDIPDR